MTYVSVNHGMTLLRVNSLLVVTMAVRKAIKVLVLTGAKGTNAILDLINDEVVYL